MGFLNRLKNSFKAVTGNNKSAHIAHAGRWVFNFILIGIIAGLGSVVFHYLCQVGMHYLMDMVAGYRPAAPAGEHHLFTPTATPFNRWILLFLPAFGGVISGWLVYTFAPEAEGHGTDAAIDAYHNKGGFIRGRVPIIKTLASAITLTTGGSGGREGPIAQIGAGFGSYLATKMKLSDRERRIMMAAGIGAGVGSIFRAPLAGALFAAEVLYRDPEFESDVIIPTGISSVVAYCIFCLVYGWGSLFEAPDFLFRNPLELWPYIVLVFVLVATGILYVKAFYGITGLFRSWKIPNFIKPAVGGFCTGIIGFSLSIALSSPSGWDTLAFGYGVVQKAIHNELGIMVLFAIAIGKIFTTSFSIGSGGSGGVFGPSVVIGGAMGGVVGQISHNLMPGIVTEPGAFVIVGMAGFFTAVSNTPISTIIFVSEMTNSYHLLLPSLLVCSLCYLLSTRWTIYRKQVKSKVDSPAHAGEFLFDVLKNIRVKDLMYLVNDVMRIPENMSFLDFKVFFSGTKQHYFPVMNKDEKLTGIFSSTDIREVLFTPEIEHLIIMKDLCTSDIIVTTPSEDLSTVLRKFNEKNIDSMPVVEDDDHSNLIGMLTRRALNAYYNEQIEKIRNKNGG